MSVMSALRRRRDGELVQEPRWHSGLAVVAAMLLNVGLPAHLSIGPSRLLLALEAVLLVGLIVRSPHPHPDESRGIRITSIALIGLIALANIGSLILLVND